MPAGARMPTPPQRRWNITSGPPSTRYSHTWSDSKTPAKMEPAKLGINKDAEPPFRASPRGRHFCWFLLFHLVLVDDRLGQSGPPAPIVDADGDQRYQYLVPRALDQVDTVEGAEVREHEHDHVVRD